jgi:hypothetical protein
MNSFGEVTAASPFQEMVRPEQFRDSDFDGGKV